MSCCLQNLPVPHQTLLFSATMPKEIEQLTAQYLNKPVKVKIGRVSVPTANVAQSLERTTDNGKLELLVALLQVGRGQHVVTVRAEAGGRTTTSSFVSCVTWRVLLVQACGGLWSLQLGVVVLQPAAIGTGVHVWRV